MSGIIGSKLNHRGSGLVGSLGTDGQHLLSSGAGKTNVFETVAAASPYDDVPLKQDIATLALHSAIADNKTAYNLPNFFIDQFEDDTGILTETDGDRNAAEYWATISEGARVTTTKVGNATQSTSVYKFGSGSLYNAANGDYLKTSALTGVTGMPTTGNWTMDLWAKAGNTAYGDSDRVVSIGAKSTSSNSNNEFSFGWAGTNSINYYENSTDHTIAGFTTFNNNWHHYAVQGVGSGTNNVWLDGVANSAYSNASDNLTSTADTVLLMGGRTGSTGEDFQGYLDEIRLSNIHRYTNGSNFTVETAAYTTDANTMILLHMDTSDLVDSSTISTNATGTLISNAQTASAATTKLSGVFLYKDAEGTATLGTDLKVYLSADNGSNFTEIPSYGTVSPLFSTGIKMIRMPETTVTSGSTIKLKAVWANQSEGSKETQLHGWAVNY